MNHPADQAAGTMRRYRRCVTVAATLISILLVFLSVPAVLLGEWERFLFFPVALLVVWLPTVALRKPWRWAFAFSLGLAVLVWVPLLAQTVARIRFILRHGGMDCFDCEGSPLAFLMGMVLEQWAFLPLSAVVWAGLAHILRQRRTKLAH